MMLPPRRRLSAVLAFALAIPGLASGQAAQPSAFVVATTTTQPNIEYFANESGGRIRVSVAASDSSAIEAVRQRLLENAAAIRRGDFKDVLVLRSELPAVQVLARFHKAIRCTVRLHARGGELVLLSDDEVVVAAIHQVLAAEPPQLH